jgi:hypothetical protein
MQNSSIDLLGTPLVSEVCDNMDRTVSITVDGETQTLEEGQIIAGFEAVGPCNEQ